MDVERRMLIARARDREQLRNQVTVGNPGLDADAIEAEVERLLFERRSAGGRKGAARARARHLSAQYITTRFAEAEAAITVALAKLREISDPHTNCLHNWPGDLDEFAFCQRCGLPYAEFSA